MTIAALDMNSGHHRIEFERAGLNLQDTPNMLYSVRGNHGQLLAAARALLAAGSTQTIARDGGAAL